MCTPFLVCVLACISLGQSQHASTHVLQDALRWSKANSTCELGVYISSDTIVHREVNNLHYNSVTLLGSTRITILLHFLVMHAWYGICPV